MVDHQFILQIFYIESSLYNWVTLTLNCNCQLLKSIFNTIKNYYEYIWKWVHLCLVSKHISQQQIGYSHELQVESSKSKATSHCICACGTPTLRMFFCGFPYGIKQDEHWIFWSPLRYKCIELLFHYIYNQTALWRHHRNHYLIN